MMCRWHENWLELGVDIGSHSRLALLRSDLDDLGVSVDREPRAPFRIDTFGSALGCLYVVEGSSLGGRFIGPALTAVLENIPTSFYDGAGRGHPRPWRIVQAALATYDRSHADVEDVIYGAELAFDRFREVAETARWDSSEP